MQSKFEEFLSKQQEKNQEEINSFKVDLNSNLLTNQAIRQNYVHRLEQLTDMISMYCLDQIQLHHKRILEATAKESSKHNETSIVTRSKTRSRSRDIKRPTKEDKLLVQLKQGLKSLLEVSKELRTDSKSILKLLKH